MQNGQDIKLLVDGHEAFRQIIRRIDQARSTIEIHMFIWRDDKIGNRMAKAVLAAADRGVQIMLHKDQLGAIFEKAEESKQSMFHKEPVKGQALSVFFLDLIYPMKYKPSGFRQRPNKLAGQLMQHPNFHLCTGLFHDHSKYYIIDDEIVILGGINIEDKEIYCDARGMKYHDYMVELNGKHYVELFRDRGYSGSKCHLSSPVDFIKNYGDTENRTYTVRQNMLRLFRKAKQSIDIVMPYIGDRAVLEALVKATDRGIQVSIILPRNANVQNNFNHHCIKWLREQSADRIKVYLSPLMTHGKVVIIDKKAATLGSANLNKNAMEMLGELNIYFGPANSQMVGQICQVFEKHREMSEEAENVHIKYSKIIAKIESLV